MLENFFTTWDGAKIAYRAWLPDQAPSRAVVLFHRGHEHSARWQTTVDRIRQQEIEGEPLALFAWDQRGHGKSDGERGRAPDTGAMVRDADLFARHIEKEHGILLWNTAVVAASLGAVLATAWVHDYAPPIRALVLAAPAFEVKLYVPLAVPFLRMKERFLPGGHVKSFVKPSMLTSDPREQQDYSADPMIFPQIAVNVLVDLFDAGRRLVADAGAISAPTLLFVAGHDFVVRRRPQIEFFQRLGSSVKQLEFIADGRHALFHDSVAPAVTETMMRFIHRAFESSEAVDPTHADRGGALRTEYDLLRTPPSLRWRAMRQIVKLGARFSDGIRLGETTGFDSGQSLDYAYTNKPAGRTPLGRFIDRGYLNAIGWRGIRARRQHLHELLRIALDEQLAAGTQVHLLDVAAGAGRYVLEVLHEPKYSSVTAELRDYQQANLYAAQKLAESLGVKSACFLRADAFDRQSIASATPRPTIAIVSGLYELFPDNDMIRRSLAGIADALVDNGLLIYTGQPWHPQVEFIARALPNREGKPWIMRRRSQAEMDALVRNAGFEKLEQRIDRWGIFTVSLARRVRS